MYDPFNCIKLKYTYSLSFSFFLSLSLSHSKYLNTASQNTSINQNT